ncbi:Glutamine transport ATP-binding protein GlnQ [Achromobacter xylosoxidans]|uniref:amino acid ABC transporter ATP-binding protein n=1 Tax=Alcaligenes xylosoxydans xylosoxydans TaxID=85698 RepID=UPI0012AA72C2|nr:amino acid ABC transporter ATP-binding protein [Achromobacter xylosoxidans]CUR72889.1 Glutamine transport ATP-binding protein GlnQ [Achromobacter xylosoxidans]
MNTSEIREPMIRFQSIEKKFGQTTVLNGVSLDVKAGEATVLIGASGSGKTTLLRCANGLEVPDRGKIFVSGEPMGEHHADGAFSALNSKLLRQRRATMGMVFQRFNLFPHMTALENVMLGPRRVLKVSKEQARELAHEQLTRVGLANKAENYPGQLSGGQQQRVAIARSLAMSPNVVLLDEPTSALDPELVGEVLNTICKLADEGLTMLIVTHEMEFARQVAKQVVFLDGGTIVERGGPEEIFSNPTQARTREFLQRVLDRHAPPGRLRAVG